MENISILVGSLINAITLIYLNKKLTYKSTNIDKTSVLIIIIYTLYLYISYNISDNPIRVFISIFILYLINRYNKSSKKESLIASSLSSLIMVISETIFVIIVLLIFNIDLESFRNQVFGNLQANIIISIISIIIINIKYLKKIITDNLIDIYFILSLILITSLYLIYFDSFKNNILLLLLYILFMLYIIYAFIKLFNKYNFTLDNLDKYQDKYLQERLISHEYKNNLLLMNNYVEEISDESNIYPDIYITNIVESKIEENKKIKFTIDNNIKTKEYLMLNDNTRLKIGRILAIIIDNAIEYNKDNEILIVLTKINNNFIIKVINHYIKKEKDERKGNGYKIINKLCNNDIAVNRLIRGNTYISTIKIKM